MYTYTYVSIGIYKHMYMYIYTRYIHIDIYALLYVVVIHVCLCTCVCAGRELNKDMLKEKAKEYREVNKDKISTKLKLDRITCECGCTSRRDKISQHKKSSCHQKLTHYLCDHTRSPVGLTVCREATRSPPQRSRRCFRGL